MTLDTAIRDVERAELGLASDLQHLAERHALEADLHHLSRALVRRCQEQLDRLQPFADSSATSGAPQVDSPPAVVGRLRRMSAEVLGRQDGAGLLLLNDLRETYLRAQEAEIAWVILVQAARARRDADLRAAAEDGHAVAEARGRWLRSRIKESAPQALAAG